jgi:nucleotide-binding universal stress UspA family protein
MQAIPRGTESAMSGYIQSRLESRRKRLLVPINANEDSRWGAAYALRLHEDGAEVDVCFLNVGEIITQWQVLRVRTQAEIAAFQAERADAFIEEASRPLRDAGIECRGFFKRGDIVFSILDTAEELQCDEIVLPLPHAGWCALLSRDLVAAIARGRRSVDVVMVDHAGTPMQDRMQ